MSSFDTAERLAIIEEWKRQKAAWKPKDGHPAGCLMVLTAVALFFGLPLLGKVIFFPEGVRSVALALATLLGLGGFVVMKFRQLPGDPRQITGDAARLLGSGNTDTTARRQAAVALLVHAWDAHGPTMSLGYDHKAAREEAGVGLEYLQSVEQVLKEEMKIDSVFTA